MHPVSISVLFCLIISTLQFTTQSHSFNTLATDKSTSDLSSTTDNIEQKAMHSGRQLLTITRNAIRITLDYSNFTTLSTGASSTVSTNLAFVLKAMQVAANFYMVRLKAYPLTSLQAPGTCIDYTPSNNDQIFGISASDLHIYVLYTSNQSLSYGATGGACKWVTGTLPDSTLQVGRPIMGRIIFNGYHLVQQETTLTNMLFQSITSTALH